MIEKNIKLVVFDMAGTTVNEDNLVYKTVQAAINADGFDLSLAQVLEHGAGKEKRQAILDILLNCTAVADAEAKADLIFVDFKKRLETAYDEAEIFTFDGMLDFFRDLKAAGINVVLNTGYDRNTAEKLLRKLDWKVGETVDALITASDVVLGRPHPEMIEKAMTQFGITDAKQVIKAGDSGIDIEEGKSANCGITVGVLSGAQTRAQLQEANPTYILEKVTDLRSIIL